MEQAGKAHTGQSRQDRADRTEQTGQSRQDSADRTAQTGENKQVRTTRIRKTVQGKFNHTIGTLLCRQQRVSPCKIQVLLYYSIYLRVQPTRTFKYVKRKRYCNEHIFWSKLWLLYIKITRRNWAFRIWQFRHWFRTFCYLFRAPSLVCREIAHIFYTCPLWSAVV